MVITILCLSISVSAYDFEVDGIYYDANINTMELTVTSGDNAYTGFVNIPTEVEYKGRTFTVVRIGSSAFSNSKIEKVTIPSSVYTIGYSAFKDCLILNEVNLSEGLKSIDYAAFMGCEALEEISIPSSVSGIYTLAFWNTGLKKLILEDGDTKIELGQVGSSGGSDSSPFEDTELEYVYMGRTIDFWNAKYGPFYNTNVKEVQIGTLVESLPDYCFANLKIKKLTIPANVTKIGQSCLKSPYLEELTLNDGEHPLEWQLYSKMPNLKTLYYGRNLDVERYNIAFEECDKITTLYIGKSVSDFQDVYFNSNLINIYSLNATPAAYSHSPFNSKTYLDAVLHVPLGCKEVYEKTEGWKNFWEIKETDLSSVERIERDSISSFIVINGGIKCTTEGKFEIYTIDGYPVYRTFLEVGTTLELPSNIYLICTDKGKHKILIK